MSRVIEVWKETFRILKRYPKILLPFFIIGALNALLLYFIYLAPQRPVFYFLGPPIRVFFGEKFLHYPYNFFLLPKLFNYGEIFLSALLGMVITAVAVGMISEAIKKERPHFLINFIKSIKRYFALLVVWFLSFILGTIVVKVGGSFFEHSKILGELTWGSIVFILAVCAQLLFIYAVPLLIIEKKKLILALKENLFILRRLFLPTLILVLIPTLIYLPILAGRAKALFLINKFFPEIILGVLGIGVAVSFFIDLMVITSTTILFLKRGE
ncbi:MAG: hypothetical protein DRP68_01675 [Candidatus Omnitrophota bacterium]|nr:MAG: hypothetical protein DRP68_01675 [Candidatus Omnitrophota bacterium]